MLPPSYIKGPAAMPARWPPRTESPQLLKLLAPGRKGERDSCCGLSALLAESPAGQWQQFSDPGDQDTVQVI